MGIQLHMNAARQRRLGRGAALALLVAAVNMGMLACGRGEELTLSGTVTQSTQGGREESGSSEESSAAAPETQASVTDAAETGQNTDSAAEIGACEPARNVVVYLCGAVENAGVYELPEGSRVVDAIRMAGGLTLMADETCVNQARILTDGEQIYIWTEEERSTYQRGGTVTLPETAGESRTSDTTGSAGDGLVNLNTADQEELTTLPGIGAAKAAAIIAYRQEHGGFTAKEELKNVSGIGDATYEKLKNRIAQIP